MGVTRFLTFLKSIDAFRKVEIQEEVRIHRTQKNQSPVIVVDAINIMYELYRYKGLSFLCGGQLKEYKEILEYFIEKFKTSGVELVFFFDGPNVMFNKDGWIRRRKNTTESINTIFDKVKNGKSVAEIELKNNMVIPRNIWEVTIFVLKQQNCKIKIAVAECDRELALYARKNNCMAILAYDTDFIIYDTVKTYTTEKMNLNEMIFFTHDKRKVLEILRLKSNELPLLATLVGNDYIQSSASFHGLQSQLCKRADKFDYKKHFYNVALYIEKLNLKIYNGNVSLKDLRRISRDIFGNEEKAELFQKSIDSYNIIAEQNVYAEIMKNNYDKWSSVVKMVYKDYIENGETSIIFEIVVKLCCVKNNNLEDFRCSDISPVHEVLRPLRKKLYGILLFDKHGPKIVEEWIVKPYDMSKPDYVNAILPNVYHPGLLSLWNENNEEVHWTLAGDVFDLDPVYAKNLPKHLLIPALSFRYVKGKINIDEWEMSALMLSAVLVSYFSAQELESIKINQIESRPIRLYNLVTCTYGSIHLIFRVLKNIISPEMALPCNYQDGKLFHLIYKMSYEHMTKEEVLKHVLKSAFENKITFFDVWKEQIDKIAAFMER